MGKIKTIIFTVLLLWLVVYLLSFFFAIPDFNDKIAIITIDEPISIGRQQIPFENQFSSSKIIENLDQASQDSTVKGIILEINSPGGTVVASKEIADKVKSIDKPVVSWIREIGTSGAYWIASSSDKIVADPLSITGSIGVISSYLEFAGLLKNYNVTYESLTTGKYKELGSPFKELNDDERQFLQSKLNQIHDYFVNEVAINRKLDIKNVEKLATGEFFLGQEALNVGLIDYLGGKDLAINVTKQLANITEAKLVEYKEEPSIINLLTSLFSKPSLESGLKIKA
ncbi:MAG TPA: signal peptide peptidase SppA [Candidatus Nanoarchaeia archaeon]|nr:signal peptide peptidase SppA [Candidatus Nanoarchaeia archaeon]